MSSLEFICNLCSKCKLVHNYINTFHYVMHLSIIKGIKLGFTNLQTHKDQREIKECLHIQNTKQITIINLFNKFAAVAADASLGLQICGLCALQNERCS